MTDWNREFRNSCRRQVWLTQTKVSPADCHWQLPEFFLCAVLVVGSSVVCIYLHFSWRLSIMDIFKLFLAPENNFLLRPATDCNEAPNTIVRTKFGSANRALLLPPAPCSIWIYPGGGAAKDFPAQCSCSIQDFTMRTQRTHLISLAPTKI